jgi:hypothetical protein
MFCISLLLVPNVQFRSTGTAQLTNVRGSSSGSQQAMVTNMAGTPEQAGSVPVGLPAAIQ